MEVNWIQIAYCLCAGFFIFCWERTGLKWKWRLSFLLSGHFCFSHTLRNSLDFQVQTGTWFTCGKRSRLACDLQVLYLQQKVCPLLWFSCWSKTKRHSTDKSIYWACCITLLSYSYWIYYLKSTVVFLEIIVFLEKVSSWNTEKWANLMIFFSLDHFNNFFSHKLLNHLVKEMLNYEVIAYFWHSKIVICYSLTLQYSEIWFSLLMTGGGSMTDRLVQEAK